MLDVLEPGSTPGMGASEIRTQLFGEDPGRAATCGIVEAADADLDDGPHAGDGQVRQGSSVAAVDAGEGLIAARTAGRRGHGLSDDGDAVGQLHVIDQEAGRDNHIGLQAASHGRISNSQSHDPSTHMYRERVRHLIPRLITPQTILRIRGAIVPS